MNNYQIDEECSQENDERIMKLEADIADEKSFLTSLSLDQDDFLFLN